MAWNRPTSNTVDATSSSRPTGRGKMPRLRTSHLIAGATVVVIGLAALWIFSGDDAAPKAEIEKKTGTIKEVKPAAAPAMTNAVATKTDPSKEIVAVLSCTTNRGIGKICEVYKTADGKTHKVYKPAHPKIFKHGTDQLMAMALCHRGVSKMPPLPLGHGNLDKQFLASLKEPIVIDPNDPPNVVEQKKAVMEGREVVKQLMDEGATFAEIMAEHQKVFNENAQIRSKAISELQRIVDEGDAEGTRQYLLKVNLALQQMGIKEIEEPQPTSVRRDEIERIRSTMATTKERNKE